MSVNKERKTEPPALVEKNRHTLSILLDNIHLHNLENYYLNEESVFKKRIDKLNLKFYLETDKYLNNKQDMEKCQDKLFLILFKQISIYIEEIERLNYLLKEKNEEKSANDRIIELNALESDITQSPHLISSYKLKIIQLEKTLNEKKINEDRLNREVESLRRQIKFSNEKIKYELTNLKAQEMKNKRIKAAVKNKCSPSPVVDKSVTRNAQSKENENDNENNLPNMTSTAKFAYKKRNLSDNNPSLLSPTSSSVIFKKRYENKESMEVSNININLNLHLKNSSTANINLNASNLNRDSNKSSNLPTEKMVKNNLTKSPIKPTNHLTETMSKAKLTSSTDIKHTQSGYFKMSSYNKATSSYSIKYGNKKPIQNVVTGGLVNNACIGKIFIINLNLIPLSLLETKILNSENMNTFKSPTFVSQIDESKCSNSFVNNGNSSNNMSIDFNGLQDIFMGACNNLEEELNELEDIERILIQAKIKLEDDYQNISNSKSRKKASEDCHLYNNNTCAQFTADFDDSSPVDTRQTATFISCISPPGQQSPNIIHIKKNTPFNSVTIDLIKKKSIKNYGNTTVNNITNVNNFMNSNSATNAYSPQGYSHFKINKNRSDSNKSDKPYKVGKPFK
jgi:hypothetical protein